MQLCGDIFVLITPGIFQYLWCKRGCCGCHESDCPKFKLALCGVAQLLVLRIWPKDEQCVAVRWTVKGVVRFIGEVGGTVVSLDGISEYRFDNEGRIYEHVLDRVDWDGHILAKQRNKLEQALPVSLSAFCLEP